MIANQEQFEITLQQLARFKGLLEAMRLHLQDTEPTLIPLVSESYVHRIQELQSEICDYLLQMQAESPVPSIAHLAGKYDSETMDIIRQAIR